ncbi:uncharacterized protein L3040_002237 [Drepanopeziza brunnea f. sp. 'multigermtubi']|uniref:uncharacterized protein n=1 Tax=Drepanopeziza brunnea f. sp. 'multigermtubi' TaxID=698441 RepID=UPI00238B1DA1|nr:hypothetical protein L3040_002237 [Drepanopeziza brunnea f. sp. 'multigermtubi']
MPQPGRKTPLGLRSPTSFPFPFPFPFPFASWSATRESASRSSCVIAYFSHLEHARCQHFVHAGFNTRFCVPHLFFRCLPRQPNPPSQKSILILILPALGGRGCSLLTRGFFRPQFHVSRQHLQWKVQYDGGSTGIADLPLASPVIRDRESHGSRRVRWSGSAVREIKMGSAGLVGDPKDAAVAVDAVAGSDSDADTEASGARGGTSGAVAGVVSADVEDASCLHDGLSPQVTARRCNAGLRLGAWDEMGDVGVDCVTTDERVSAYGSTRLGVMSILVFLLSGLGVAIQEHRLGGLGWDRNLESDSGSRVERVTEAWGGQVK